MKKYLILFLWPLSLMGQESFHRAEQDREISYWLLDPASHQFRISHDFTVTRVGQKSVHSFVRKGSVVSPDARMIDLDSGKPLVTHNVAGKDVNALGYYPTKVEPDSVAVQGDLDEPVAEGLSKRIRVEETYTDPVGYVLQDGELLWKRTLGRPVNYVTLPAGWMLTSVNTPAIVSLDDEGRIKLRFMNIRNDDLSVAIKARRRPTSSSRGTPTRRSRSTYRGSLRKVSNQHKPPHRPAFSSIVWIPGRWTDPQVLLHAFHNGWRWNRSRGTSFQVKSGGDAINSIEYPAAFRALLAIQLLRQRREVHSRRHLPGNDLHPSLIPILQLHALLVQKKEP